MTVVLVASVVSLALAVPFTMWVVRTAWPTSSEPCSEGTASSAEAPTRRTDRCLLCNGPLPVEVVTRDEVIAQVERRIGSDTQAVARLLANPPSADWASLFRPSNGNAP